MRHLVYWKPSFDMHELSDDGAFFSRMTSTRSSDLFGSVHTRSFAAAVNASLREHMKATSAEQSAVTTATGRCSPLFALVDRGARPEQIRRHRLAGVNRWKIIEAQHFLFGCPVWRPIRPYMQTGGDPVVHG